MDRNRKSLSQFTKNYSTFALKIVTKLSKIGFWIRNPEKPIFCTVSWTVVVNL
jgi:hypothetical protein